MTRPDARVEAIRDNGLGSIGAGAIGASKSIFTILPSVAAFVNLHARRSDDSHPHCCAGLEQHSSMSGPVCREDSGACPPIDQVPPKPATYCAFTFEVCLRFRRV